MYDHVSYNSAVCVQHVGPGPVLRYVAVFDWSANIVISPGFFVAATVIALWFYIVHECIL